MSRPLHDEQPDMSESPQSYAARIAKYISDPSTIRARTLDEWGRAPTRAQCANLRAKAVRRADEFRRACELRATPQRAYDAEDNFACGHERSMENTFYVGNRETCITCKRELQAKLLEKERRAAEHQQLLNEAAKDEPAPFHVTATARILARAAELTGISTGDITGPRRFRRIVRVRQAVIHALHAQGKFSLPAIASRVGIKDHTSVIHNLRVVEDLRQRDPKFEELCRALVAAGAVRPEPVAAKVVDQFMREAA